MRKFIKLESSGGIILFAAALAALVIDNSPISSYYQALFGQGKPLLLVINDGLMTIFFLLVGLEIKREILTGELNSPSKVMLPAMAALGGMIAPALIYIAFNAGDQHGLRGWAIPTATDIAFSLGILSLLGSRIPSSLRIFLTALAIFDDLGAIIIIALFYASDILLMYLLLAFVCVFILFLINRKGITNLAFYFAPGALLWFFVLNSGVHPTLAGVIVALAIPMAQIKNIEQVIHPWVAFGVLPIFAFANAGVSFFGIDSNSFVNPITLGIGLGLFAGKLIGVFFASFVTINAGLAKMPAHVTWMGLVGTSLICGVGFTMSFFVGTLAFGTDAEPYAAWMRAGIFCGSGLSGLCGYLVLRLSKIRAD